MFICLNPDREFNAPSPSHLDRISAVGSQLSSIPALKKKPESNKSITASSPPSCTHLKATTPQIKHQQLHESQSTILHHKSQSLPGIFIVSSSSQASSPQASSPNERRHPHPRQIIPAPSSSSFQARHRLLPPASSPANRSQRRLQINESISSRSQVPSSSSSGSSLLPNPNEDSNHRSSTPSPFNPNPSVFKIGSSQQPSTSPNRSQRRPHRRQLPHHLRFTASSTNIHHEPIQIPIELGISSSRSRLHRDSIFILSKFESPSKSEANRGS